MWVCLQFVLRPLNPALVLHGTHSAWYNSPSIFPRNSVGPLWAVDDGAAHDFAVAFYQALRDGATLGRAVKRAQERLATLRPGDTTRLAYSVYGHANARVLI